MVNSIIEILDMMKQPRNLMADMFEFNIGKVPMKQIKTEDVQAFVDYVKQKIQ